MLVDYVHTFRNFQYYKKMTESAHFHIYLCGYLVPIDNTHTASVCRFLHSTYNEVGGQYMSQQQRWRAHPSHSSMPGSNLYPNMPADDSSTFVKPLHDGSRQSFSPYTRSAETAIPPPPPYLYPQPPSYPKRNRGYLIAIVLLTLTVMGLGFLEVIQLAGNTLLTNTFYGSMGSNQSTQSATTSVHHATASLKATPLRTLTPATIKENITLGCGVCNDPILTTINTITIDTTNLRLVWVVKLNNESGAEQVDNFNDFNLQDPNGNIYEGTGNLNTVFILSAGQIVLETEIFSFLPRPGVSYTLIARLGGSGITYDPVQFTF